MSIIDVLARDHREIMRLIDALEETAEGMIDERSRLFGELRLAVMSHGQAEATTVYRRLQQEEEAAPFISEIAEEYSDVEDRLEVLSGLGFADKQWFKQFEIVDAAVSRHVKKEKDELFRCLRQMLKMEEQERMAVAFEAERERILAEVSP